MTVLCGGSASQPKPNVGENIIYNGGALAAVLESNGWGWLATLVIVLGTLAYDATTQCSTDPPAIPAFTVAELLALSTLQPSTDFTDGLGKLKDLVLNLLWYQLCECSTAPQPALPAAGTPPSGFVTSSGQQICLQQSSQSIHYDGPSYSSGVYMVVMGPKAGTLAANDKTFPLPAGSAIPIPAGATTCVMTFTLTSNNGVAPNNAVVGTVVFYNAALSSWVDEIPPAPAGSVSALGTYTVQHTIAGSPAYWIPWMYEGYPNITFDGYLQVTFYCNGATPASPQGACCPPDPNVVNMLLRLQSDVSSILAGLPTKLNSYASGTVHAGLTGNGTVTLAASVLAVQVDITADAGTLGESAGDPVYLFDRGYIVPIVNSAPVGGLNRLVYNPQLVVLPELTEQIGYSLHPGVTASITELVAGP